MEQSDSAFLSQRYDALHAELELLEQQITSTYGQRPNVRSCSCSTQTDTSPQDNAQSGLSPGADETFCKQRYVAFTDPMTSTPIPKGRPEVANTSTQHDETYQASSANDLMPHASRAYGAKVKAATYDGSSNWLDYKAHFEVVAELNKWSYHEKGLYLAASLRGQAQGVFGNLGKTNDYLTLVTALEERFAPPNQTELYRVQLRERRQKATESLSELGQDVRRLTNMAYPTAPADVRETLAKEQFIDSLISSDLRIRVKQARPKNLNDAVRHAVELEAYNRAEKKHLDSEGYLRASSENMPDRRASSENMPDSRASTECSKLQEDMESLKKVVADLSSKLKEYRRN